MQLQFITQEDIINLVQDPNEAAALANALTQECIAQKFNGLTLETGVPPHLLRLLIVDLAKKLHDESMELILVIPPIREMVNNNPPIHMSKEEFDHLSQHVDRFSIMTYDFSTSKSGPNAPIDWLRDNLEHFGSTPNAHKLLMGLNLYGMYFTPVKAEPITGSVYLERLRTCEDEEGEPIHKLVWDKINQEHVAECFNDGDEIEIWYPSKRSIHDRLELAKEYGVGLSLWEVGQGLDYFYDRL
ncbi:hypothetical protein BZG36_01226 [Bifiguratus adelaidae]|uniref:Chitinase domain-containing protein 1 n=1 Tax=Bifiguratus adelaidae TaxID=1938954 RepID=A0A261Y5N6_9FUNG|nr:hypothetical protein BZG36_01226 [Bifiguratus adelaidae]